MFGQFFRENLRLIESKSRFYLVISDLAGNSGNIFVESSAHIFIIAEDESFFNIKPTGYNVTSVLPREGHSLFRFKFMFEQEFLIICGYESRPGTNLLFNSKPVN